MDERIRQAVGDAPAWVVGGALRDELIGREIVDVDVACPDPEPPARRYSSLAHGAVFPLSERHGAWRVAFRGGNTVDFTPLHGASIEEDLATRDFTVNALARPLDGGPLVDPFDGAADLRARRLRAVGAGGVANRHSHGARRYEIMMLEISRLPVEPAPSLSSPV